MLDEDCIACHVSMDDFWFTAMEITRCIDTIVWLILSLICCGVITLGRIESVGTIFSTSEENK